METQLLECVKSFQHLLDIRYHIVLGRAGKHMHFDLTFDLADCHHLMGLHYLVDRHDRRSRTKIITQLINSEKFRKHIASSDYWDESLKNRLACTKLLESYLDDNNTVFRYNPKRYRFYSHIKAEYLLDQVLNETEVYLFIDKRADSEDRFCRSIFPKADVDYTEGQAKWTLLYKSKEHISSGKTDLLYKLDSYTPDPTEIPGVDISSSPDTKDSNTKDSD